jgi:hypothetical protein
MPAHPLSSAAASAQESVATPDLWAKSPHSDANLMTGSAAANSPARHEETVTLPCPPCLLPHLHARGLAAGESTQTSPAAVAELAWDSRCVTTAVEVAGFLTPRTERQADPCPRVLGSGRPPLGASLNDGAVDLRSSSRFNVEEYMRQQL